MARFLVRCAWFAPLLLSSCNVVLTWFGVPLQANPGSVATVAIAATISGTSGEAGCVLQLPNGWVVQGVTNNQMWHLVRDEPPLLALYAAEPGHYLAGFSGSMTGAPTGGPVSQITLAVSVLIPANALGAYRLKVSMAGSQTLGLWQIQEPPGVSPFAAITALPYARTISVGVSTPAGFANDSGGLPPDYPNNLWSGVACGDVDGDGRDDLAAVSAYGTGTRCWLSRPGTTWIERSNGLPTSTQYAQVAFADLDADGFLDLVDGNGHVCFGDGGTSWTLGAPPPLTLPPVQYETVAVGDVDGDGLPDIAIGSSYFSTLEVLLNNGNRTFRNVSAGLPAAAGSSQVGSLVLADLDGDGDLDLLWVHGAAPTLWLGDGQGGWTQASGLPPEPHAAVVGDLDGDGIPEIVAGVPYTVGNGPGLTVFRHTPAGAWVQAAVAGLPTIGKYSSLAILDFDRDGLPDLVAGQVLAQSGIEAWRNTGAGFTRDVTSGLPHYIDNTVGSLVTGDFDGNTFPDLVIATIPQFPIGGTPGLHAWQNRRTGVAPFGTGCAGGTFVEPRLVALGAPVRGNASFAVQVHTQAPGVTALFWLGGSRVSTAPVVLPFDVTPLGAPGCTVWTSIDYPWYGPVDAAGVYTVGLPVPNAPVLAFVTLFAQGGVFAASANPFGMVFSGALALRVE